MRGLLATAYAFGFAVFSRLARRALRRSDRHSARALWCHEQASALENQKSPGGANSTDRTNGDAP